MTQHEALGDMISVAWAMTMSAKLDPTMTPEQKKHIEDCVARIEAAQAVWRAA